MKKNILIALLGIFASCQDERLELKEKDLSTSQ
ncbi:hypothetical protein Lbys_3359 [Leadbetterella byssophila DSM 17132]|jgi:hypothetical protein|uniref:Uncharacterized protein n=1 Tax=Leadbetterella byssophila (strain DSM 17132 / JCM 16389 / KACC 11308 / NBRC 106382 / 4M15) TaxID=649349 RepID=E4RX95_LEAB4|nr:hypothetical protein Lbys_3359 [Leadbetterella byssophila DSM 17132]